VCSEGGLPCGWKCLPSIAPESDNTAPPPAASAGNGNASAVNTAIVLKVIMVLLSSWLRLRLAGEAGQRGTCPEAGVDSVMKKVAG
jgi:hypothetical protein